MRGKPDEQDACLTSARINFSLHLPLHARMSDSRNAERLYLAPFALFAGAAADEHAHRLVNRVQRAGWVRFF
jgi:hypothetical protein